MCVYVCVHTYTHRGGEGGRGREREREKERERERFWLHNSIAHRVNGHEGPESATQFILPRPIEGSAHPPTVTHVARTHTL